MIGAVLYQFQSLPNRGPDDRQDSRAYTFLMVNKHPLPRPVRPAKPRNEFGDQRDTVYAGGTPLFDERTGKAISKRDYVRKRPTG
jgi:hypothetical protein